MANGLSQPKMNILILKILLLARFGQSCPWVRKDADLAVKAAKAAFDTGAWADMRPTQRGKL